ncbi:MAG: hypothetical protein K2X02_01485 [Alphaproteobacteria bacterium]|nr:hypothetical protein [Alphaproteobacteria bacterium]
MFQSSAQALLVCNNAGDPFHYGIQVRQKGTSKVLYALDLSTIGILPGETQKLKFKDREVIKFLEAVETSLQGKEKRSALKLLEGEKVSLKEEGALEVIIRIGLGNDMTLCTLENLNHLIFLHDFAHADVRKDENNTYTLKLTGLRDTSSLIVTEGKEVADESRG